MFTVYCILCAAYVLQEQNKQNYKSKYLIKVLSAKGSVVKNRIAMSPLVTELFDFPTTDYNNNARSFNFLPAPVIHSVARERV